jgi:hypothetical protein
VEADEAEADNQGRNHDASADHGVGFLHLLVE